MNTNSIKSIKFYSSKNEKILGYENLYKNIKKFNSILENSLELEIIGSDLVGFGTQILKVKKKHSETTLCYLNEKRQVFFPKPIQHNDFMQVYNLIETYQLFAQEEKRGNAL